MKGLGVLLLLFGIGSMVLHFMNYEFTLLSWIDTWGETTAWVIRGGLVAVGGAMLMLGRSSAPAESR